MFGSKVAKRYSQGIFDFTQESNKTDIVFQEMKDIIKIVNESSDLRVLLKSPIIDYHKKIEVIDEVFKSFSKETLLILNLILRQGRGVFLKEIASDYIEKVEEHQGLQKVNLTVASDLDEKTINGILKSTSLIDPNKKVKLNTVLNPDILGGYILKVGDLQVDESVKTKLYNIRKEFKLTQAN